jgi:hypothetical protein
MDLARAKAISDVAQTIINSAKVEVDLLKALGGNAPGSFFGMNEETRELPNRKLRQLPLGTKSEASG